VLVFWDGLEAKGFGDAADGGIFERCTFDRNCDAGFRLSHARAPIVLDAIGGEKCSDSAAMVVVLRAIDLNA